MMSQNDFRKVLNQIDGAAAPVARAGSTLPLIIIAGMLFALIGLPILMKVLFDPATALMEMAIGGAPFLGLGGTE